MLAFDHVELHRGELPDSCEELDPNAPDSYTRDFMKRVQQFGNDLELIWNPVRRKWSLYRCAFKGASRSGDLLKWEFDLDHPPGDWLITKMQTEVLTRCDRSSDHNVAGRRWLKEIRDGVQAHRAAQEKRWDDLCNDVITDLDIYAFRGRRSDAKTRRKRRNRRPAVRDGAPRIRNPGIPNQEKPRGPLIQIAYR